MHVMCKYTAKIVRKIFLTLLPSSFCVLKLILPACGPKFCPTFLAQHNKLGRPAYSAWSVRTVPMSTSAVFGSNRAGIFSTAFILIFLCSSAILRYWGVDGSCPYHRSSFCVKLLLLSSIPRFYDVVVYVYRRTVFRLRWRNSRCRL